MLGLTYLWPDEPIEPDEPVLVDGFSNPVFQAYLRRALANYGYFNIGPDSTTYYGVAYASRSRMHVAGDYKFGAQIHGNPPKDLMAYLEPILDQFRLRQDYCSGNRLCKIALASVQHKPDDRLLRVNSWFTLHAMCHV